MLRRFLKSVRHFPIVGVNLNKDLHKYTAQMLWSLCFAMLENSLHCNAWPESALCHKWLVATLTAGFAVDDMNAKSAQFLVGICEECTD